MNESVSDKAKTALREIGLTEYEIRAYMHLLQTGVTTASQISENTEVPYSKIYETLNSLEKKGWIRTQAGRPRRYYPMPPVEAFEATKLRFEDKVKAWQKSVLEEIQPLYDKREIREKPDVWILRGEFDTIAKLREMIENTENELMVAAPMLSGLLIDVVLPVLRKITKAGVKIYIMLSKDNDLDKKQLSELGEIRVRDQMFGGGVIADGREALLILGEKRPLIIWSDHPGLVKFAKDYFSYLWNTAQND